MMIRIPILIIRAYQHVSQSLFPRTCRFYPTCSHYAVEALDRHGLAKGLIKICWRILRCSPLSRGGYDPIG